QLRQIDRVRARRLYRSLLEADLAIKGHRSQRDSARGVIETLILQLSREAQPSPAPSSRTPSRR
ncbi:MAG TPA: hypothetical protein PJ982_14915, partial [Lacipirellulaceae bacterium]|nr:hypothetical protein [Lacipirellulaceae bacterium]